MADNEKIKKNAKREKTIRVSNATDHVTIRTGSGRNRAEISNANSVPALINERADSTLDGGGKTNKTVATFLPILE